MTLESTLATRWRLLVLGRVQGIGFRPFVHRLAAELDLGGRAQNTAAGVSIEIEGPTSALEEFLLNLRQRAPAGAAITSVSQESIPGLGEREFRIEESAPGDRPAVVVPPDRAMCPACREDIADPDGRRREYAFTTCTDCGPRYSVIASVPYDRARTAYKRFSMCAACEREYRTASDRRFHSQTNGCAACGPQLRVVAAADAAETAATELIAGAAHVLDRGGVVALKAVGGYQILCDARDEAAVRRVRAGKRRPEKPLAVLVRDLAAARRLTRVGELETVALTSPEAPIVLAQTADGSPLAPSVAPGSQRTGVFLPTTPLHALLIDRLGFPVVATSGNRSGEPLATTDEEAATRLSSFVDLILGHDRPILRPADDSVVQINDAAVQVIRCARGYAPLSLPLPADQAQPAPCVLALGGFLKGAIALSTGGRVVLGPHLGDLDHPDVRALLRRTIDQLTQLHGARPELIAADSHPAFPVRELLPPALAELPVFRVQHHHAHVESCRLEHELSPADPLLGLSWDGTGYGTDGTIWGGEFLLCRDGTADRLGRVRPFPLFGGDSAVVEPWRSAVGTQWRARGEALWDDPRRARLFEGRGGGRALLTRVLTRGVACVETSSIGRLFDAASFLAGFHGEISFEGQAAIALEDAIDPHCAESYAFALRRADGLLEIDWEPALDQLIEDAALEEALGTIAARFHNGLASAAVRLVVESGHRRVALTGGAFQNRALTARIAGKLRREGAAVFCHRSVPPGDGGLAAGQLVAAIQHRDDR